MHCGCVEGGKRDGGGGGGGGRGEGMRKRRERGGGEGSQVFHFENNDDL